MRYRKSKEKDNLRRKTIWIKYQNSAQDRNPNDRHGINNSKNSKIYFD